MTKKFRNIQQDLYFITILVLTVGIININLTLLGLSCFILPFYYFLKYKDKVWCKYICPRSGFFTKIISKINLGKKSPKWLLSKKTKYGVLAYFMFFMTFAAITTVQVAMGLREPSQQVNFLVFFEVPFTQVFEYQVNDWMTNLSYSIYSMLLTSTAIGVMLGIIFKPKTWCVVCPISTLTTKSKK